MQLVGVVCLYPSTFPDVVTILLIGCGFTPHWGSAFGSPVNGVHPFSTFPILLVNLMQRHLGN